MAGVSPVYLIQISLESSNSLSSYAFRLIDWWREELVLSHLVYLSERGSAHMVADGFPGPTAHKFTSDCLHAHSLCGNN